MDSKEAETKIGQVVELKGSAVSVARYDSDVDYDYSGFDCGVDSVNNYLHVNMERGFKGSAAAPHLAVIDNEVIGYFTLASHAIEKNELRGALKASCHYRSVSAIIIGKLGIDEFYQGDGMGKWLLGKAIRIAWEHSRDVGTKLVVLNAREGTEDFYIKAGFIQGKFDRTLFIYPLKQFENKLKQLISESKKGH